jgi:hypothetical protein
MCCSSFFYRILRLFHLTNTHRHPIIDLIRREMKRENTHTRSTRRKKTSNFILCFALLLCVSKKKSAKRISILSFNIHLKSFFYRILRLFHLTNTHRHPIIDLIRRENTHARQGEKRL